MGTDLTPPTGSLDSAAEHRYWESVEARDDFRDLVASKIRFVAPAVAFFLVYYFALPVLVGYFPGFMETKLIGDINLAYLFALSEFVMAWAVMYLYLRRAKAFDAMAARIVAALGRRNGGGQP